MPSSPNKHGATKPEERDEGPDERPKHTQYMRIMDERSATYFVADNFTFCSTRPGKAEVVARQPAGRSDPHWVIPSTVTYEGKTYSVTSIQANAFEQSTSVQSVSLPHTLNQIGEDAFRNCSHLAHVSLPPRISRIGAAAFAHTALTSLSLPKGLTVLEEGLLMGCEGLRELILPNSLREIEPLALAGCIALTELRLPAHLEGFYHGGLICPNLNRIDVDPRNRNFCSVDGIVFDFEQETLMCYPPARVGAYTVPEGITALDEYAFAYSRASHITLPSTLTTIGESAFSGCSQLERISIPTGVEKIEQATFSDCTCLAEVSLPDGLLSIGPLAFSRCTNLRSLRLPNSLSSIEEFAFDGCTALTTLHLPQRLLAVDNLAFSSSDSLRSITVDEANPNYTSRDEGVLYDRLTHSLIYYPPAREGEKYTVATGTLGLASLAFGGTRRLKQIYLPGSVTHFDYETFGDCEQLTDVYFDQATPIPLEESPIFAWYNFCITLHVPPGCREAYVHSPGWGHFDHIVDDCPPI